MNQIYNGDCAEVMASMESNSVDAIVTDPPYGLSFMNKEWDSFGTDTRQIGDEHYWAPDNPYGRSKVRYGWNQDKSKLASSNRAFQEGMTPIFVEALRVAKPGAHLLCFGGTRTFHRTACAIEDAGWEIRDTIMWVYGSGFPKSLDVGKAIDKALGAEREKVPNPLAKKQTAQHNTYALNDKNAVEYIYPQPVTDQAKQWDGWGTCLKPAWEPIIVARKPLDGTVANNVLKWGTGALNIDACRVPTEESLNGGAHSKNSSRTALPGDMRSAAGMGMFAPGARCAEEYKQPTGRFPANLVHDGSQMVLELFPETGRSSGGGGRFFYCAKASKKDRGEGNSHPTVKPTALMEWLVTLVTPQGGVVLDPFAGSGTTLVACERLGFDSIGIEREPEYVEIIRRRLSKRLAGE